jgi:uncharacterized membrane protein YhaH (DUF805 family)
MFVSTRKSGTRFKAPFSFEGRIRRKEYGITIVISVIAAALIQLLAESTFQSREPLIFISIIMLVWFFSAQGAKRCHDIGNSGWYQLIPLYVLWMLLADSEPGDNQYGPNPKGIAGGISFKDFGKDVIDNNTGTTS